MGSCSLKLLASVPVLLMSCRGAIDAGRVIVTETDSLYRRPRSADLPMVLSRPNRRFRTIAKLYGYQDADRLDEDLWYSLRRRSADLGADAIVFIRRGIIPCEDGGGSGFYIYSVGDRTYGSGGSEESRTIECTLIEAAAILIGEYDCDETQNCRTARDDAMQLDADRDSLGADTASAQSLGTDTSSTAHDRAQ